MSTRNMDAGNDIGAEQEEKNKGAALVSEAKHLIAKLQQKENEEDMDSLYSAGLGLSTITPEQAGLEEAELLKLRKESFKIFYRYKFRQILAPSYIPGNNTENFVFMGLDLLDSIGITPDELEINVNQLKRKAMLGEARYGLQIAGVDFKDPNLVIDKNSVLVTVFRLQQQYGFTPKELGISRREFDMLNKKIAKIRQGVN